MPIQKIRLTNFRNFHDVELDDISPELVLISAPNGSGKSNLLEAMYIVATGSSPRTSRLGEVILWDTNLARIALNVNDYPVSAVIRKGAREFYLYDKKTAFRELNEKLAVVFFHPPDLNLLSGGPKIRRTYLDRLIAQINVDYLYTLSHFRKLLMHRNALLRGGKDDEQVFDALEEQLAADMAFLYQFRVDTIAKINRIITANNYRIYYRVTSEKLREMVRELMREYAGYGRNESTQSEKAHAERFRESVRELMREKLREKRERERAVGFTLVGPQRDDWSLFEKVDEADDAGKMKRDLGIYGSRGEQRMAIVRLKLSECDIIQQVRGVRPVLLLDDVFSELDESNNQLVFGAIPKQQTFITATSDKIFTALIPAEKTRISRINLEGNKD